MLPCWRAHHVKYKGSTGIQWPPTPTPGLKGMNPYGFDDAASITSKTLIHYSHRHILVGETGLEFPFPYSDDSHCGKIDGPEFVDQTDNSKVRYERKVIIGGRFKL